MKSRILYKFIVVFLLVSITPIIVLFFIVSLFGSNNFGEIIKVKGDAYVKDKKLKVGDKVAIGSTIYTKAKSRAIIKFKKDTIVLNQNSELLLDKKDFVIQKRGNIFNQLLLYIFFKSLLF